jgi:hypothetical protein
MADQNPISFFEEETTHAYRGETYLVRDNGSVLRRAREGKRLRPLDETWTFGNPCKSTGYMTLSGEKVHRIVATAFHGEAPSKGHVVDHIDTNRRNNRPNNLRWVTRLENVLLNPVTAKRVAYLYGSVEAFLENPKEPLRGTVTSDFEWMRAVTPEEGKRSLERMTQWAQKEIAPRNSGPTAQRAGIGEWIYRRGTIRNPSARDIAKPTKDFTHSHTGGALQRNWRVPATFPLCPKPSTPDALVIYADRLVLGAVAVTSDFGPTLVDQVAISRDRSEIYLLGRNPENKIKGWSLMRITFENIDGRRIVHESLGTFFQRDGAEHDFTEFQGLKWRGEDSIDNFC